MLFKEFLTEINSNKTKQNLRKPTITDRQRSNEKNQKDKQWSTKHYTDS